MATLTEQLDLMLTLKANWDGYNADPIQPRLIALAKDFVEFFQVMEKVTGQDFGLFVHPTRVGGVQIEWQDAAQEHELEIDPDGSLGFLHIDRATGAMTEKKFSRPAEGSAFASGWLPLLAQCGSGLRLAA